LATIITDAPDCMTARLARIARLRLDDSTVRDVIWGLHIEGPFLSDAPGYAGTHPAVHLRPADLDVMKRLLDAAQGTVRLVTLAPECDRGLKVTKFLATQGVRVAAGHCNPSRDELLAAIDAGVSLLTHLGNGCPRVLDRHENIIQRALSFSDRLTLCFIGDGVHVPYFALGNYLRLADVDRAVVVTDAMAAAGCGPGRYTIGSQTVEVGDDRIAWAPGRLQMAGSTATMPRMAAGMQAALGLTEDQIDRLLCHNPREVLVAQ
jgi:N-acetylglucosamine-6-phosphate deacetylase